MSCLLTFAAVGSLFIVRLFDPNRNLQGNLRHARGLQLLGKLNLIAVSAGGDPEEQPPRVRPPRPRLSPIILLLAGAGAVFPLFDALPGLMGWPRNKDCSPEIVAPGDVVRIEFPQRPSSLGGFWRGSIEARLENAAEFGLANAGLSAWAESHDWPETIYARYQPMALAAWLTLPDQESLAGNTLRVSSQLAVIYPHQSDPHGYIMAQKVFDHGTEIRAAPLHASQLYRTVFLVCLASGGVMILLAGVQLLRALLALWRSDRPGQVRACQGPEGASQG